MAEQRQRQSVRLDPATRDRLNHVAARQGHVRAGLLHAWVVEMARAARAGVPMPPHEPVPSSWPKLPWTQGDPEFQRCVAALDAAGSSVGAAVRSRLRAYLAADGDLLTMPSAAETAVAGY